MALDQTLGTGGDAVEGIAHDLKISASGFRDDQALSFPHEKLEAKLSLQRFHLMARGTLRDANFLRRPRELS